MHIIRRVKTSFIGPAIDDHAILERLPEDIAEPLRQRNGFIAANGGFHHRGACLNPLWHSIRAAWEGEYALHQLYPELMEDDIPLAEDCFGDQYLLRDGSVVRLFAETGEVEAIGGTWAEFLMDVSTNALKFLELNLLRQFETENPPLEPGYALSVYPPFIAKECRNPSMRPIPALELRAWHADFARQIKNIPDGQKIKLAVR
jgi:hypothetical protein